jgi:16S rRNA (guanine1516-N2)-methyltransferase
MIKIANHCHYHKTLARELIEGVKDFSCEQPFVLTIEDDQLSLCGQLQQQQACFTHSLSAPKLKRRAMQKNQALLKACNNKKQEIHHVVDLTAGWGKDSYMLASHGQQLSMLEQNSLVFNCMNFLIQIAQHEHADDAVQRMNIIHQNSADYLSQQEQGFADCLYLDPMFPAHKSSARPSKDLQILQILTDNLDVEELFEQALTKARYRVVVKRPIHAPPLDDKKPDIVYREKTIRFDVYLTR